MEIKNLFGLSFAQRRREERHYDLADCDSVSRRKSWIGVFLWVLGVLTLLSIYFLSILFPEWRKVNEAPLSRIEAALDPQKFIENLRDIDWSLIISPDNKERTLILSGTHPHFDAYPGDKGLYTYLGEGKIIMSDYVTSDSENNEAGLPLVFKSFNSADSFCSSLGGRLPTWEELFYAHEMFERSRVSKEYKDLVFFYRELKEYRMWTSSVQSSWFVPTIDNYAIFNPSNPNYVTYEDDQYEAVDISFRCVKDI